MRGRAIAILLGWCLRAPAHAASPATLPVYIEDSHAGTFYWTIQNLALHRDYQLVLIDAHSDASELLDSDSIRERILDHAGRGQMAALVRDWRTRGVIQCFNWIEPLMPHPIAKVWWIPADSLSASELETRRREVCRQINAHEPVAPRQAGDLGGKYEVVDLESFVRTKLDSPVVVTIDLDYFASEMNASRVRTRLQRILDYVIELPNLQALTFSISRPYLASEAQAHLLLYEALRYLTHMVNVSVRYEPLADIGPDRSELAKELYRRRQKPPRHDLETAPAGLRTLFLQNASRIAVAERGERWKALLDRWRREERPPSVRMWIDGQPAEDGTEFTISADRRFRLKVERAAGSRVTWHVLAAAHSIYNLAGESQGFANGAPTYLHYRDQPLDTADGLAELDDRTLLPFFDRSTGLGTVRLYCELVNDGEVHLSNVIRISRYRGEGYTGKLTEIFNLPYIYGSALLKSEGRTSADARQGSDCSHFIVYGHRRQGADIPYVDPKDLLAYLEPVDEFTGFHGGVAYGLHGPILVPRHLFERGLLLHFGKHVAAIYGNFSPSRELTAGSLVVHQLEGPPEITTFQAMAAKYPRIRIMTFR